MKTNPTWPKDVRLNESRLEALLRLSQMAEASLQEITDFALEQAVALTESKIGYLAFANEDETVLTMHSWSRNAMAQCAIADKPLVYPVETTGLWGEAIRQRKPIITNDYSAANPWKKGLPEGHCGLMRHMNVPILDGQRIVIVAGAGNKETDYDESDVRQLTLLMEGMWRLLQRHRLQVELRQHRDHLQQLVEERTGELAAASEALRQSHEELKAIYERMVDGVLVADIETKRFVRANPAICKMLGYSEAELLGMSVTGIHPKNGQSTVLDKTQVQGHLLVNEDCPVLRKDGSVLCASITTKSITYNGRPCLLGFLHDISERKRTEEALEQDKRILKRLLEASDHERQLIGYDIHDGLAQQLAAALMQFEVAACQKKARNPKQAAKAQDLGAQMVREAHVETRRLISGLKPPFLEEGGLVTTVEILVQEANKHGEPRIDFHSSMVAERLDPMLETAVFRIIQESITNARRHSHSERISVHLGERDGHVQIEVQDWGVGFDPEYATQDGHFGLEGIQQRARAFGGHALIQSTPGQGTCITVDLPIPASPLVHE